MTNAAKATETTPSRSASWQVEEYMAKGFDRETAEALAWLNDNGQRRIG